MNGGDPCADRQREKLVQKISAANTFRLLADEWHKAQLAKWTPKHGRTIARRLQVDLYPILGDRPIAEIDAPELLATLRKIERRGSHDIAHHVLQIAGQVFRYAIVVGRAPRDPSRDLKGALVATPRVRHHAALSEAEMPDFLNNLEVMEGLVQTKLALRMLMLTFVRTGELRGATWGEFDLEKALWCIPAERMKAGIEHLVPLSRQVIEVLLTLRKLNGHRSLVFPNQLKPISENIILYAIYRRKELTHPSSRRRC